eukprot:Sspe_Gene.54342::Locus_30003_Transcript_1_7_Confidence_0.333_Length_1655::g.54342::m.54342
MTLDLRETEKLVNILQMEDETLESILKALKALPRQEGGGRITLALRCMMLDNYYHTVTKDFHSELLITSFILWSLGEASSLPLPNTKSSLYQLLMALEGDIRELKASSSKEDEENVRQKTALKAFLLECLVGKLDAEALKKTPRDILKEGTGALAVKLKKLEVENKDACLKSIEALRQASLEEQNNALTIMKGVSPLIVLPDAGGVDSGMVEEWGHYKKEALDTRFDPPFDRPRPPPMEIRNNELSWLYTEGYTTDLVWDVTMGSTREELLELRERMQKALQSRLPVDDQQALVDKLAKNPDFLLRVGVTPLRLPSLVERNINLATGFLQTLLLKDPRAVEEFLTALVNMNPCHGAYAVMMQLMSLPELPVKFAHEFLTNALNAAQVEGKGNRDKRLFCVFCSQLIRQSVENEPEKRILENPNLTALMNKFAIDNANTPDGRTLYKTIREVLGGGDKERQG